MYGGGERKKVQRTVTARWTGISRPPNVIHLSNRIHIEQTIRSDIFMRDLSSDHFPIAK